MSEQNWETWQSARLALPGIGRRVVVIFADGDTRTAHLWPSVEMGLSRLVWQTVIDVSWGVSTSDWWIYPPDLSGEPE